MLAKSLMVVMLCSVLGLRARGQTAMAGHDMGQTKEIPSPEKLPAPLRMSGLGNSHLKITASPEAQIWFDQGLNLLHDFWDYEAARSFEQGVRVDPQCAMCFWGLYQTLTFRHSLGDGYSKAALASALALTGHVGKTEKLYIEAAVADSEESGAKPAKSEGEGESKATAIYREIVKRDGKDLQAKIFLAGSLNDGYEENGEPKKGTQQAIAILDEVLKVAPNDSAANHYWIHAMEPSSHPERAIKSAELLASLAPASGHMVHMPGHIFYRVGEYGHAERWFAESTAVDEAYMRDQHVVVDDDWNYVHNLMYGVANLMEEGKMRQATLLSGKLAGARGEFSETLYLGSPRDGMTRVNMELPLALRTGDWAGVLTLLKGSEPDKKLENLLFLSGELKQFAAGMRAVETGDLVAARAASDGLDADLWRKSQTVRDAAKPKGPKKTDAASGAVAPKPVMAAVMPDATAGPLLSSLSIMSLELRGSIFAAEKKLPEAKAAFRQAALEEKALGYREPPTYIRPVGETEGLALLGAGDAGGAHEAYTAALAERPNSGFGLYGLARSSEAAGKPEVARAEYAKFVEAWKDGDASMPEMAHARSYLGQPVVAAR